MASELEAMRVAVIEELRRRLLGTTGNVAEVLREGESQLTAIDEALDQLRREQ
jgi:hypothetical protein